MAVVDSVFIWTCYGYIKPLSPKHKCHTGGNISERPVLMQEGTSCKKARAPLNFNEFFMGGRKERTMA